MKAAVVLAAGASRRMGKMKQNLRLAESTVLGLSVETLLDAGFAPVRVVRAPGAHHELPRNGRIEIVDNPAPWRGLASSIRRGLTGLADEIDAVAIALADKPLVRKETLLRLQRAFDREERPIAYPIYRGQQGHPVLWGRALFEALRELEGDRGAKDLLERHRALALAVPVRDPGVCLDIDTPEDYARAKALIEKRRRRSGV